MLRAIMRHWELKLVSLALAFGLWLLVTADGRTHLALAAPVEYVGLGRDLVLVGEPRDAVDVRLEAARWAAAGLSADAVRVRVNLAGLGEGESLVPLSADDVRVPKGVTVTRITPAELRVALAPAAEGTLRIRPRIRGAPAPGYTVARVAVEPPALRVRGPRFTIEARGTIEAAPVDVSGRRERVTQTVGLVLPAFVSPTGERSVRVSVEIKAAGAMQGRRGTGR